MKKYILLSSLVFFSFSCNGQDIKDTNEDVNHTKNNSTAIPEGTWKVDKVFDKNGNLVKYDSIYSWSSNMKTDSLAFKDKDSIMQSFKSRFFSNFSQFENEGFENVFAEDSLFSNHFFNDQFFVSPFGKDFMDIDKIRLQMIERQKKFLEKYQSELFKPEDED